MTNHGLSDKDIKVITDIFDKYCDIRLIHLFGSRAKGTHTISSDIDLAIMNEGVSINMISQIKGDFEESSLPYFVDLIDYTTLQHPGLKEHIDRVGVKFYEK